MDKSSQRPRNGILLFPPFSSTYPRRSSPHMGHRYYTKFSAPRNDSLGSSLFRSSRETCPSRPSHRQRSKITRLQFRPSPPPLRKFELIIGSHRRTKPDFGIHSSPLPPRLLLHVLRRHGRMSENPSRISPSHRHCTKFRPLPCPHHQRQPLQSMGRMGLRRKEKTVEPPTR